MFTLTEDLTKAFLSGLGLPVPKGMAFDKSSEAARYAGTLSSGAVVKALIPTGRRGKAGAVVLTDTPEEVKAAAGRLLGTEVHGFAVEKIFVESKVEICREFYLSFSLDSFPGQILISSSGGVDIEETHARDSGSVIRGDIDPIQGVTKKQASSLWQRAGVTGDELAEVISPL